MQQVVSARDSQHQDHPVGDWLAANPLAALTLLGVVLYALIRLGHSLFYSEFGLSPNEVGLGYGDALARAAGFAAYVLLFVAAILTVFWAARRKWPSRRWQIALIAFACVVSIVFVVFLARESADRVKRGELVRPIFLYDLGIRAEPARIAWIETPPDDLADLPSHKLMFLGDSGGMVVVYDVDDGRTLKLPTSAVALSLVHSFN